MRSPIQNVLFLGLFNINCNTIYIKIQILPKIKVTQNQGFMPYLNPTGKKDRQNKTVYIQTLYLYPGRGK